MTDLLTDLLPNDLGEALAQLREAKETLRAIGAGEVDAFLIADGATHHRVFTLSTADRPYRMFVEHMRDGAATVSADGLILYANDRLAGMLARPKESIVGASLSEYIAGGQPEGWLTGAFARPAGADVELELLTSTGRRVPTHVGAAPIDVDGEHLTCLTFTDLTEERAKDAEINRLHHAEVAAGIRLTAVVEALQEGVLVQDERGRVLQANRMASMILDVPRHELVTDPPSPLLWSDRVALPISMSSDETPGRQALESGQPVLGILVTRGHGAGLTWLEINAVPVVLPGEPDTLAVISSFRDVTTRVSADEAIRFQAQLLDTAGQAIIALDGRGNITYWNKHAEQMYGWTASEAVGRSVVDLIVTDQTLVQARVIGAEIKSGETWSGDHWVRRRDGTEFPVFATSTPTFDEDGKLLAVITVATDITDRKRAEQQARRLTKIVESSSDAIIGMTLDRVITTWNPGATCVFGYGAEEAIGQNLAMLAPEALPGAAPSKLSFTAETSFADAETLCRTKSGAVVHISLSISPIKDEHGRPVSLSGIGRDITERIALEQLADHRRQQLLVAEHAADLEGMARAEANRANHAKTEFLSRMSHELRTPLNAVLGFSQVLLLEELTEDQRESVAFISRAGDHLLDLINDVLDISRIEAGGLKLSLEPVNLHEVIGSACDLIRPQAAQRVVSLPVDLAIDEALYAQSDRQRLLQILLNLLSNAVKYNRPNGSITLRCDAGVDTISIGVIDTGLGITSADLRKLFTPFERLGAEGTEIEGTGVGLALSRSLTEQMGGTLTVQSVIGRGSTFTLTLPRGQALDENLLLDAAPPPQALSRPEKILTVLAIDDNVANIRLMERIVQNGDNVFLLTAMQGRRGLDLATQHRPDLILLDLHLPDLHGEVVLDELMSNPTTAAIPVIICSGDSSPAQRRASLKRGAAAFLAKPIHLAELFEMFEQVRRGEAPRQRADPIARST
jgi:PAS domain S-box-containing protein